MHRDLRPRLPWGGRSLPPLASLAAALLLAGGAAAQEASRPGLTLDQVVRATLAASHDVRTAALAVERQRGAAQAARGAFDPRVSASASGVRSADPTQSTAAGEAVVGATRGMEYAVGVDRRFRNGLTVTPQLTFSRVEAPQAVPSSAATASVDVRVPLARGRGGGVETARERAARLDLAASRDALRHRKGEVLLRSVEAYWGYAAAAARLEVLREAEARAERLVDETRRLVEADARPAADLLRVHANRASKHAARVAGEQGVAAARQDLALAMGIPAADVAALATPAQALPAPGDSALARLPTAHAAAAGALRARADLAAAGQRRAAARDLLRGARGELRPQVDLSVRLGYTGVEDGGGWDPLLSGGRRGMHAEVKVSSALALGNRAAAGEALQSAAADQEAAAEVAELTREVAIRAATAVETLRRALDELKLAGEAVRLHAAAVDAETRKFRLGSATLFDVITSEDALTAATLARIDGQLRYAAARARLGFETGALDPAGDAATVDVAPLAQ